MTVNGFRNWETNHVVQTFMDNEDLFGEMYLQCDGDLDEFSEAIRNFVMTELFEDLDGELFRTKNEYFVNEILTGFYTSIEFMEVAKHFVPSQEWIEDNAEV